MIIKLIFESDITVENLIELNEQGLEFVIEDGQITEVIF